nr:hypothetical protein [Mesorhizobium sediminum]
MIEKGIVRLEGPPLGERKIAIGICRRVAGEFVLDERHDECIEATRPTVREIDFNLLPGQFRNQRPRGIAVQEEGAVVCIDEVAPSVIDAKRESGRPRGRSRREQQNRYENGTQGRRHSVI